MKSIPISKLMPLLRKYKIPFSELFVVKTKAELSKAAKKVGFPLVLKVVSQDISVETESTALRAVESEELLESTFEEMLKSVRKKFPRARLQGIGVQRLEQGKELVIKARQDSQFGSVVSLSVDGIYSDFVSEVTRVYPIDESDALEMVEELTAEEILKLGKKSIRHEDVAKLIVNVSKLIANNKNILELELNPIVVDQSKIRVIDAKVALA